MSIKEEIYEAFHKLINEKVRSLQRVLDELKESGKNETKSTAGDKHETALAMLQIEQENKRQQLSEALEQKRLFEKIDPAIQSVHIIKGSLVKTNRGYLLLSVAAGKVIAGDKKIFAISEKSPLGARLMGLRKGDKVDMNGLEYLVEAVE